MVKILLDAGADIEKKYIANKTPLMLAIETSDITIINEILNEVPNPSAIKEAISFTKTDAISKHLGTENTNKIFDLLVKAENQYNLYEKIKQKKSDSDISDIKTFIATTPIISLNVTNIERNPLINAIETNNLELVTFLIRQGADVNQIFAPKKITPLAIAIVADMPNIEIIKLFLQKGANPNIRFIINEEGDFLTPLGLASISLVVSETGITNLELIEILLKYKAKINDIILFEGEELTVLTFFALAGNVDMVQKFLEAGADPSLKNSKGQTAVDIIQTALAEARKATSEEEKKRYEKEKQNYEKIIKLLKTKEKEIASQSLLPSLKNLTQRLKTLQQMLH